MRLGHLRIKPKKEQNLARNTKGGGDNARFGKITFADENEKN